MQSLHLLHKKHQQVQAPSKTHRHRYLKPLLILNKLIISCKEREPIKISSTHRVVRVQQVLSPTLVLWVPPINQSLAQEVFAEDKNHKTFAQLLSFRAFPNTPKLVVVADLLGSLKTCWIGQTLTTIRKTQHLISLALVVQLMSASALSITRRMMRAWT
jgi:hypothetical protein